MRSFDRAHQGGFAFLWVLAALAMVGVLVASGAQTVSIQQRRDRELELLSIGRQFRTALQQFHDSAAGGAVQQYPTSLDDLLLDRRDGTAIRRYLRKIYTDPITGNKNWGLVRVGGVIVGIYSNSDRRPIKQRGFEGEENGFNDASSYRAWVFSAQAFPPSQR
jgi:type II secretory pathway pseudopilin PulG